MKKLVHLLGYPLGHSISPAMQNAAFHKLGLDYEYSALEVPPENLAELVGGLREPRIAGFNVTVPHKEKILSLLDEITPVAKLIGAVNTVKNQSGRLIGYNTDGAGFIESLKQDAAFDPAGKKVVIIGAGGASRAVAVMLAEAGAKAIVINDVQKEKAAELAEYLGSYFPIKTGANAPLTSSLVDVDLLVNASPIGMSPRESESPLPDNLRVPTKLTVYDLVYNPMETALLRTAKGAGCRAVSGLGMLVRQGALAFTIWTGQEAPVEVMRKAALAALGN